MDSTNECMKTLQGVQSWENPLRIQEDRSSGRNSGSHKHSSELRVEELQREKKQRSRPLRSVKFFQVWEESAEAQVEHSHRWIG
jgi:hypothetical protein